MTKDMNEAQLLTIITHIIEKHGCRIKQIDIENRFIDLQGPEEAKVACAVAIAEVLG